MSLILYDPKIVYYGQFSLMELYGKHVYKHKLRGAYRVGKKINILSFFLSLICLLLFLFFQNIFGNALLGIHPLNIILTLTLFTFLIGVFGFSGIQDWKCPSLFFLEDC